MAVFPEHRLSMFTLGVANRAALTSWYEDVLGFRNVGPEGITVFDMGGFALGFWERDKLADDAGQAQTEPEQGFKGVAIAYNARSEKEVDEIFARLNKAGAEVTKAPHKAYWGGYSGYFADPEGNAWEVAFNPFWPLLEDGRVKLPKKETA